MSKAEFLFFVTVLYVLAWVKITLWACASLSGTFFVGCRKLAWPVVIVRTHNCNSGCIIEHTVAVVGTEIIVDLQYWHHITLSQEWPWIPLLNLLFLLSKSDKSAAHDVVEFPKIMPFQCCYWLDLTDIYLLSQKYFCMKQTPVKKRWSQCIVCLRLQQIWLRSGCAFKKGAKIKKKKKWKDWEYF